MQKKLFTSSFQAKFKRAIGGTSDEEKIVRICSYKVNLEEFLHCDHLRTKSMKCQSVVLPLHLPFLLLRQIDISQRLTLTGKYLIKVHIWKVVVVVVVVGASATMTAWLVTVLTKFRICSSEQGLCFDVNDDDDDQYEGNDDADDEDDGNDDADDDEHLNEVHCSLQVGNLRSKQAALRGGSR